MSASRPGRTNSPPSAELGLAAVTSPPAARITVLDASGGIVSRAAVAGAPHDVTFVPGRTLLWVSAEAAARIVALDPGTGRLVRFRATGGRPDDLAVSPDGRRLWVTIDGSDAVEVRDALTGMPRRRTTLGGAPHDLAFAPGGRQVRLSNFGLPSLTVASASGRRRRGLRAGSEPHHFAFGLGRMWASDNGGGALLRMAPGVRRTSGRAAVGPAPHHVAIAAPRRHRRARRSSPCTARDASPSSRPPGACSTGWPSAQDPTASTSSPPPERECLSGDRHSAHHPGLRVG